MATFDIGQVVTLNTTVKVNGVLTTPTTISLVIFLPDATTVTNTPTASSTGVYAYDYTPTQAGRHVYRFVTTGAGAGSSTPTPFEVLAAFARYDLLTLEDAKQQVNITNNLSDTEISDYMQAVTETVEDVIGSVVPVTVVETRDGGSFYIVLRRNPVLSVTQIREMTAGAITTLPVAAFGGTTIGYRLKAAAGILERVGTNGTNGAFPSGAGTVEVTYVAGLATVPPSVNLAARIIFQHLWRTQNGGGPGLPSLGDDDDGSTVYTQSGYLIPRRAYELLASRRRGPRVG